MLAGILGSMLVAGSAVVAYKNYGVTQDSVRVARVKSMMTVVEAQLRRRALQPEAYVGCDSENGLANCNINSAYFADLTLRPVTGARCASPGTGCGIRVTNLALLKPSREFRALISYDGRDATLKPVAVSIVVPAEVLQDESFNCGAIDAAKPIFTGFDASGKPICLGFNGCAPSEFISAIDVANHTVTCSPLPANAACSGQQMFANFHWNGSGTVQTNCVGLADPPFASNLRTRRSAQAPPPNTTPPTILTVTSTATQTGTGPAPAPGPSPNPSPTPTPPSSLSWVFVRQTSSRANMSMNSPCPASARCPGHTDIAGEACSTAGTYCLVYSNCTSGSAVSMYNEFICQ